MKKIPFSPPHIDEETIELVTAALRSGWITTGPLVRELESMISAYTGADRTLCLNSWTNAVELVLRWFGVGPGDEVIIPAYTYAATANIVVHVGATPVVIDSSEEDFLIDLRSLSNAISPRTKVIMPVDIGGMPVDYEAVMSIAKDASSQFLPGNERQKLLGRPLVISDAAHSFGARVDGKITGNQTDVMGFSFHAVKNLTTAEGGALTLQLPEPFDNTEIWKSLSITALHGQTKDALSKSQAGQWQYDIIEAGYKCNLTDVHAAIGIAGMRKYESDILPRRKAICALYDELFRENPMILRPEMLSGNRETSYHLYMIRIVGATEQQRDAIITRVAEQGISTNVHFQPLPRLTYYRNIGLQEASFPNAMRHFSHEISLPVYYDLSDDDVRRVSEAIIKATQEEMQA